MNSSLRQRLERLGVSVGPPAAPKPPAPRRHGIEDVVPGRLIDTGVGRCFVVDEEQPADARYGGVRLAELHRHNDGIAAHLGKDDRLRELDWRRAVFVDIETSGLAGGTGTYAFLVGAGYFDHDLFRVRQFFMRDPTDEPALIQALSDLLDGFDAVVTFNGKAFDLPLLVTRFTLFRRHLRLADAPHLDLLHPARRLWSARLASCALTSLEQVILGLERHDDVPGFLIPSLYFDYIRSGNPEPLRPVFSHNVQDIVSMVILAERMCTTLRAPDAAGVQHGLDWYSLGRCYEDLGWSEQSTAAYRRALAEGLPPALDELTRHRLSMLHKRHDAWDAALDLWHDLIQGQGAQQLSAFVELAKYYEHRVRDYETALDLTRQAIELAQAMPAVARGSLSPAELHHRLERLSRKIEQKHNRESGSLPPLC
jgi:uncharacterized protein YprB with RNaseH-like and TPR domain